MLEYLFACAMAAALMLTPRTLAIVGNLAGSSGFLIFPFLLILVLGFLCLALGLFRPYEAMRRNLTTNTSSGCLFFLPMARFFLYCVYTTSIAALAGYIFNEVFVYWFPNLLFSFLLLGAVCLLQLANEKVVKGFQLAFVLLAFAGILGVTIGSFNTAPVEGVVRELVDATPFLSILSLGALLFVGFDMAGFDMNDPDRKRPIVSGFPLQAGLIIVPIIGAL
jgi:hypothetical protein